MKLRQSAQISKLSWPNIIWIGSIHVLALTFAIPTFSWDALALMVFFYYLTGMVGITFGFHRLLTHRAFKAPVWLENFAALAGTLACQGGPVSWIATHRLHHAYSDTPNDPHDASRGFWWSHAGWLFNRRQDLDIFDEYKHYAPHMASRPFFVFLEKNMILIQIVFGLSLMLIGALVHGNAQGLSFSAGFSWVIWGVFVRLMLVYNVTWFVNSAAHKWGNNSNNISDLSKNCWWVGLLAFGEGWHNNHHAQPRTARHGWHWWQVDQTWIMVKTLNLLGILKDLKLPELSTKPKIIEKSSSLKDTLNLPEIIPGNPHQI
jgi:fatty-acid desaturase